MLMFTIFYNKGFNPIGTLFLLIPKLDFVPHCLMCRVKGKFKDNSSRNMLIIIEANELKLKISCINLQYFQ